jgi:hypothetical protein
VGVYLRQIRTSGAARHRGCLDRDRAAHNAGYACIRAPRSRSLPPASRWTCSVSPIITHKQREHARAHHPREENFKENIIDHFAQGIIKKPVTVFGNVKADVLALKDPNYKRVNLCSIIFGSG